MMHSARPTKVTEGRVALMKGLGWVERYVIEDKKLEEEKSRRNCELLSFMKFTLGGGGR